VTGRGAASVARLPAGRVRLPVAAAASKCIVALVVGLLAAFSKKTKIELCSLSAVSAAPVAVRSGNR
jgi:hypothetical protein